MNEHGLNSLLTVEEMARADAMAIDAGVSGEALMEVAGKAVADTALQSGFERIAVLCGPGNNGGDGFVAARYLRDAGKQVRLGFLGSLDSLKGDVRKNADKWQGKTETLSPDIMENADCVIDAIFGAGLARDLDGVAQETIESIGDRYCIAVDVPSGVHGNTGEIMETAHKANKTVTFFRLKPGHLLFPGREYCGDVQLVDIGIPEIVLDEISPTHWRNAPDVWKTGFPWPSFNDHKYSRGHAIVVGGADMTGAAQDHSEHVAPQRSRQGNVTPCGLFQPFRILQFDRLV